MKPKDCNIIQELAPLYAENLVSPETAAYIEGHLAGCPGCTQVWENFIRPLPDPLPPEKMTSVKVNGNRLFARLRKTVIAAVMIVVMGGAGLAYASYTAGKHVGLDDPSYRYAQELGLFTEINQSKMAGENQVNIDQGLFDSTRSVMFINFSSPVEDFPQLIVSDEKGQQYEQRSSKGWQNKYFMFEFEPLELDTQSINAALVLDNQEQDMAEFTIPVDVVKTAQYSKIIYPNQERLRSKLRIALEKAVLGVSEAVFKVRLDWPLDGSVAGIGLGREIYFPTSVRKAPDTPPPPGLGAPPPGGLTPGYASTVAISYRSEEPPAYRPALYDLTGREEAEVQGGEYRTTQFPCQIAAILKFAPVKQETEHLELLLPPVYLYEKVAGSPDIQLNFQEKSELDLARSISYPGGKLVVEKVWLAEKSVCLSYRLDTPDTETVLPHFELTDTQGMKKGRLRFDRENPQVIIFGLYDEDTREFVLNLDSIGKLLPREKFTLDLREK